jgi:TPR repeat protein
MSDDFQLYLDSFPNGTHRDLAQARIDALKQAAAIQGYVMEDGQTLSSRESLRRAALEKVNELPVMFVQYGLIALGFPIADPSGIVDTQTRRAIRAYQSSIGATQTGDLTPRQTVDLVLAAAAVGDQHAETAIGVMTASGIGFDQNDQVARMWLSRAADRGNKYAQANLAVLYRDGRGGDKDVDKARSLLKSAVAQGLQDAEPLLRDLGG